MPRKNEPESKNLPAELQGRQSLQSYEDYVQLIEKVINGVLHGDVGRQDAHTVAILTGYGINALREARGGKLRMSVFLQDVHKQRINLDNVPPEMLDSFCQGNDEIQMEILNQLKERGNITAEVRPIIKKAPQARMDTKLISNMAGVSPEDVTNIFKEEGEVVEVEIQEQPKHDWKFSIGGTGRFCSACGAQREVLQPSDMTSICSQIFGLE